MSDVDDDLEFLRAFEDELYNDTLSDGSDDSLDSELEAELYQNVHFASSLVETPTNNSKEEKCSDESGQLTSLDSEINGCDFENSDKPSLTDCVDGKDVDQKASPDVGEEQQDNSTNFYPEVELVFSKDEPKNKLHKIKRTTSAKLFEAKSENDGLDNSLSDSDDWGLIAADLIQAPKTKKRFTRCFNCNERGHRTLECTVPKKEKICWLCGEVGHLRKRCRNELCFNCSEPGHQVKNCRKPRCRADDTCHRCHAYGHFESFCPDRWRQYHHTIKEGEIVRGTQSDSKRKTIFCYNCGEKGHLGHECVEETQGYFDPCFPFVVKYDRFTSNYPPGNTNRNIQTHDNTKPSSNSSRKTNRNSYPNDDIKLPSHSQRSNQIVDSSNQNLQKSKRSQNKKKRAGGEVLDEGGRASKRRKVEDSVDDEVIPKDHWDDPGQLRDDRMETFTDFNHSMPNLPLQSLMSADFDFMNRYDNRKRKRKNSQDQNLFQNEDTETNIKKKKKKPGQKKRKALKNKFHKQQQTFGNAETNNALTTENGEVKKKKNKRKKRGKGGRINLEALSSTANFTPPINFTVNVNKQANGEFRERIRNHSKDERMVMIEEPPKKPWKKKRKNDEDKRSVYFNYTGFL